MEIFLFGLLGVIISIAVGILWYSTKTPMGRLHLESLGFTKLSATEQKAKMDEMKPKMWKYYLAQIVLSFLTSAFIAFIMIEQKGFIPSMLVIYGEVVFIWLCFTVPVIGQSLIWGDTDLKLRWKKFFSDSLSNLVTYLLIIFVFSWFI